MAQRLDNATSLYLEAIRDGNYAEAINTYGGARYTQHSTPVKDGKEGFVEFFADFAQRNPTRDIEIIRGFEDRPYVFLHVVQILDSGRYCYVTADIFDTDDEGKLIEHWDIIEELRDTTVGGRTQVDGPTEISDLDKTEDNKQLVVRFVNEVLVAADYDRLSEFMTPDYAEHNLDIADDTASLQDFATESEMRYIELHKVVGAGNFVAILAESESDGKRRAAIDRFRLEHDKIVEHWDVREEITPEDTWVNSGKFSSAPAPASALFQRRQPGWTTRLAPLFRQALDLQQHLAAHHECDGFDGKAPKSEPGCPPGGVVAAATGEEPTPPG